MSLDLGDVSSSSTLRVEFTWERKKKKKRIPKSFLLHFSYFPSWHVVFCGLLKANCIDCYFNLWILLYISLISFFFLTYQPWYYHLLIIFILLAIICCYHEILCSYSGFPTCLKIIFLWLIKYGLGVRIQAKSTLLHLVIMSHKSLTLK